jgi:hypothetical protein
VPRQRHHEFLRFLWRSDGEFPPQSGPRTLIDACGTHEYLKSKNWLAAHRRSDPPLTPGVFYRLDLI